MTVYCWGRGEDGQLGVGDTNDQFKPIVVESLQNKNIRQVACGSGHTILLTQEGTVWSFGRGDDGRLGHGDSGWKYVPRLISALESIHIDMVTCGSYHTAAVTSDGRLYTWGGGMYGKLGTGNVNSQDVPCLISDVFNGKAVLQVACGSRHTIALIEGPSVYAWGDKENGVCGHGNYAEENISAAEINVGVSLPAAADNHDATSNISSSVGLLSSSTQSSQQLVPKVLPELEGAGAVQISACGFHSCVLTSCGQIWSFGEGKFGRLGNASEGNRYRPHVIEGSLVGVRMKAVSCGGFHTAGISDAGELYTWGGGEHGQLGHGDLRNCLEPRIVSYHDHRQESIVQVTCGWSHTVARTDTSKLLTFGNGDHGKLGHGTEDKVLTPTLIESLCTEKIYSVASYNEHTIAFTDPFVTNRHRLHRTTTGNNNISTSAALEGDVLQSTFTRDIYELVRNQDRDDDNCFSDVTFIVQEERIFAHRAILASRSEHFAAMFRSGMRESYEKEIVIPEVGVSVFKAILDYIYCDSLENSSCIDDPEEAIEVYVVADLYQMDRLKALCEMIITSGICVENAASMLYIAHSVRAEALLNNVCLEFIIHNMAPVARSDSYHRLPRELLILISDAYYQL